MLGYLYCHANYTAPLVLIAITADDVSEMPLLYTFNTYYNIKSLNTLTKQTQLAFYSVKEEKRGLKYSEI